MPDTNNPGLSEDEFFRLLKLATETSYIYSGAGSYFAQYQTVLSGFDKNGYSLIIPNHELSGLVFITRPELNLSAPSLGQDRILSLINTVDPMSLQFSIRTLLDTKLATYERLIDRVRQCPWINNESPFLTPLTNCYMSSSGWPDVVIDTETMESGFYGEDITIPKGSDLNMRSYDFTLNFRDIQGGYISQLLYTWIRFIELVIKGIVIPYPEYIFERRMCFTSSIYRFVLDPSRTYITKWAKATGCFPKSFPWGAFFNQNEREPFITATAQYSIPFTVNHVAYQDPQILWDFNQLMRRFSPTIRRFEQLANIEQMTAEQLYAPSAVRKSSLLGMTSQKQIDDAVDKAGLILTPPEPQYNFKGLPYIDTLGATSYSASGGMNKLLWVCDKKDITNEFEEESDRILKQLTQSLTDKVGSAYFDQA